MERLGIKQSAEPGAFSELTCFSDDTSGDTSFG